MSKSSKRSKCACDVDSQNQDDEPPAKKQYVFQADIIKFVTYHFISVTYS